MHFSGRVPDTMFSNHLLGLEDVMVFWNIEVEAQTSTHRFGCDLQLQIGPKCVDSKFSETKTHPCSSNGVFHQCNFTSTQSAATKIKNQGRSPKSSYWSKNNRRKNLREAICCIKQLWSVYLWQLKNQFSSFCPKHWFLNQGVMMESHEQNIHIKGTKLITNSKSLRNGFRFFHVIFILDALNKRLSWDLQNSVRVVGGSGWWLLVPGNPITSRLPVTVSWPRSIGRNRLNHQLNSLQQWLNWLKKMFWMFLSSGPHDPEPGWSATRDLQSTSLGQRRGSQIRTEVHSWLKKTEIF